MNTQIVNLTSIADPVFFTKENSPRDCESFRVNQNVSLEQAYQPIQNYNVKNYYNVTPSPLENNKSINQQNNNINTNSQQNQFQINLQQNNLQWQDNASLVKKSKRQRIRITKNSNVPDDFFQFENEINQNLKVNQIEKGYQKLSIDKISNSIQQQNKKQQQQFNDNYANSSTLEETPRFQNQNTNINQTDIVEKLQFQKVPPILIQKNIYKNNVIEARVRTTSNQKCRQVRSQSQHNQSQHNNRYLDSLDTSSVNTGRVSQITTNSNSQQKKQINNTNQAVNIIDNQNNYFHRNINRLSNIDSNVESTSNLIINQRPLSVKNTKNKILRKQQILNNNNKFNNTKMFNQNEEIMISHDIALNNEKIIQQQQQFYLKQNIKSHKEQDFLSTAYYKQVDKQKQQSISPQSAKQQIQDQQQAQRNQEQQQKQQTQNKIQNISNFTFQQQDFQLFKKSLGNKNKKIQKPIVINHNNGILLDDKENINLNFVQQDNIFKKKNNNFVSSPQQTTQKPFLLQEKKINKNNNQSYEQQLLQQQQLLPQIYYGSRKNSDQQQQNVYDGKKENSFIIQINANNNNNSKNSSSNKSNNNNNNQLQQYPYIILDDYA